MRGINKIAFKSVLLDGDRQFSATQDYALGALLMEKVQQRLKTFRLRQRQIGLDRVINNFRHQFLLFGSGYQRSYAGCRQFALIDSDRGQALGGEQRHRVTSLFS